MAVIVDAGRWIESVVGIDRAAITAKRRRVERLSAERATDELLRSTDLLDVAGDVLDQLHRLHAGSGHQVAGALRLLIRIDGLLGGELDLRVGRASNQGLSSSR